MDFMIETYLPAALPTRGPKLPGHAQPWTEKDMESLLPGIQQITSFNLRIAEAINPVFRVVSAFQERIKPVTQGLAKMQKLTKGASRVLELPDTTTLPSGWITPQGSTVLPSTTAEVKPVVTLPKEAQWSEQLECRFTDQFTLSVSYQGNVVGRYDYAELGFGKKNMKPQRPDVQWELLHKLATLYSYEDGKLVPPTAATLTGMLEINEVRFFQRMRRLSKKLQDAFGIYGDPFLDYLPATGYRTKFRLRSEALLQGDGELHPSGSPMFERRIEDASEEADAELGDR